MSLKETLLTKVLTLRHLFIVGNFLLLLSFMAVLVEDHRREWKPYQKEYFRRERERLAQELANAPDADAKDRLAKQLKLVRAQRLEVKQIMLDSLGRYDRCQTCHTGMDSGLNPSLTTPYGDHPFAAPPNPIHAAHPQERFGCTVCHEGQDLATSVAAAHGDVEHWEKPMLRGVSIQAACVKCHPNVDDAVAMPYTSAWRRGEALFKEKGCIGCHQIRGEGGPISVDLAEDTANKPLSRIDFSYTGLPKQQHTLANWIRLHFVKDPQTLVPGDPHARVNAEPIAPSGMPFFDLSAEDADALTTFVLALGRDRIPADYYVPSAKKPESVFRTAVSHGCHVYEKYGCAACHGKDAKGGTRNYNYENEVEPDITKTVATFTRDELREKIEKGVPVVGKKDPKGPTPPLYMPAWKDKIKGPELEDLLTYLFSIAEKSEEW